jgi:DNA-directed RNA polymerase specialized sigma24 family protein
MANNYIERVAEFEKDWLGIAATYVGDSNASEAVQEMYIKIGKHADERIIKEDGDLNRSYVFLALRSCCFNFLNKQKKVNNDLDVEHYESESTEGYGEAEKAFDRMILNVESYAEARWTWYDRTLFLLYMRNPFSIRKLAEETGISWMSIHGTIKRLKEEIKEEFSEDWEDYTNQDFELIKINKYERA